MNIDEIFNITDRDRELYNIYSRMTDLQLLDLNCIDAICRVVKFERLNNKGDVNKFASMTIGGLLPILSSFPTFNEGLGFIESFKPGFRYSKYFKQFAESYIEVNNKDNKITYNLGDHKYVITNSTLGYLHREEWYLKDKLHNPNGPASITYFDDGNIKRKRYSINGVKHREDGPSQIDYNRDGSDRYLAYLKNGKFHRTDGPAIIEYFENGKPQSEIYYSNDLVNRIDAPAIIEYYENGDIWKEQYYVDGKRYRVDGPAILEYYEGGILQHVEYYVDGYLHKSDGPAVTTYNTDGVPTYEKFYDNGRLINTKTYKE